MKFKNGMKIEVNGIVRTLRRWTKGEYDRVYINGGTSKGDGYVDLKNKEIHVGPLMPTAEKMAQLVLEMEF